MIYLHVGSPKTGTTTIQRYLHSNQLNLLKQNVLYPSAGIKYWGHHNIYYDLAHDPRFDVSNGSFELLLTKLSEFKSKHPKSDIILSSETFCTMNNNLFEKLYTPLSQIDQCMVIIYLRNQIDFLKSFWSLQVRNNHTQFKFDQWATQHIETNSSASDYLQIIDELSAVCTDKNIKIIIYDDIEKAVFIDHFMSLCKVKSLRGFHQLDSLINNASDYSKLPIPKSVRYLCKNRYYDSNLKIAKRFLDRDFLFKSMAS